MNLKNSCSVPLKPTCVITFCISAWMRATSSRPIWWICAGVRSVVVEVRTLYAYQASPSGSAVSAMVSRHAGRYSFWMKSRSRVHAGISPSAIVFWKAAVSRVLSASEKLAGIFVIGPQKSVSSGLSLMMALN